MAKTKPGQGKGGGQGPVVIGDDGSRKGSVRLMGLSIRDTSVNDRLLSLDSGQPAKLSSSNTIQKVTAFDAISKATATFDSVSGIQARDSGNLGFNVGISSSGVEVTATDASGNPTKTQNSNGIH